MTWNYFLKPNTITSLPVYPVSPWWEPAPAAWGTQRAELCLATAQLTAAPRSTQAPTYTAEYTHSARGGLISS